jgi:hypothetical protein
LLKMLVLECYNFPSTSCYRLHSLLPYLEFRDVCL